MRSKRRNKMDNFEDLMMLAGLSGESPTPLPEKVVPAMAYVPYQQPGKVYSVDHAIEKGTMFPELSKPFLCGKEAKK